MLAPKIDYTSGKVAVPKSACFLQEMDDFYCFCDKNRNPTLKEMDGSIWTGEINL